MLREILLAPHSETLLCRSVHPRCRANWPNSGIRLADSRRDTVAHGARCHRSGVPRHERTVTAHWIKHDFGWRDFDCVVGRGSARLARLIVSVCFAGQVSLLLEVGHGTLLDGSLDMLPFAALVALVAYGDRRVVVTAGVLLAAAHVTAWRTSEPASAMAMYVAIIAVHVAGLS